MKEKRRNKVKFSNESRKCQMATDLKSFIYVRQFMPVSATVACIRVPNVQTKVQKPINFAILQREKI